MNLFGLANPDTTHYAWHMQDYQVRNPNLPRDGRSLRMRFATTVTRWRKVWTSKMGKAARKRSVKKFNETLENLRTSRGSQAVFHQYRTARYRPGTGGFPKSRHGKERFPWARKRSSS